MASIENLTIEITAEATSAINALAGLLDALRAVNAELDRLDPSRLRDVAAASDQLNQTMSQFGNSGEAITQLVNTLNQAGQAAGNVTQINEAAQGVAAQLNRAGEQAERASRAFRDAGNAATISARGGFRSMLSSLRALGTAVTSASSHLGLFERLFKSVFRFMVSPVKLATKAMQGLSKANDETVKTAKRLAKELTRVGKMLKLMVTRMALRAVIKEVGNGFKSLALHSEEFNNSVSGMINGAKKLGYSFSAMVSPLINALAPAISYVISLLVKLMNVINQVFSALAGGGSWNKAKDFTNNWADDIKAANKSAKELKKTVLGFDELNQLQDNKNSGGGGASDIVDMFETVPIEDKWKDLADYIKKVANKLFEPLKKAWEKVGDFVKKSWKYAMDEVFKLGKSVARDFWKVWEQEKTQKIFENILKIVGWIGQAVGNLAKRFREAWDKNDTGLHILENIRNIVLVVTDHFERMAKATADWADNLNFEPLLESLNKWLESLEGPADAIMGILEDFYTDVLLPIGKWAVEEGGPKLLKVFTDFNDEVDWDGLRTKLDKLWKTLEPFAKTVGEGLIIFIDDCVDALREFINGDKFESFLNTIEEWMQNVTPQDVANGLEKIAKAIAGLALGKAVIDGMVAISSFLRLISSLAPLLELAVVVTVAYGSFKLGGLLGKWLTGDSVYDEYSIPVMLKWTVSEMPTSWNDFTEKLQDWMQAWDDMCTKADDFVKICARIVEFTNPILNLYHTLFKVDTSNVQGMTYSGGSGANIEEDEWNKTIEAAREATEAARNYKEEAKPIWTASSGSGANIEADEWNSTIEAAREAGKSLKDASYNAHTYEAMVGGLTEKQKALKGTLSESSAETDKLKTSNDNLMGSLKNQKTDADNLNKVLAEGKEAYKNYRLSMEEPVKYAPVFNKGQQDMTDALKKLGDETNNLAETSRIDWEHVDSDVVNASGVFDQEVYKIQECVKGGADDITEQTDKISDAFSEDNWTFDGVIDGLKKTFSSAIEGVKKIWNKFVNDADDDGEIGGSKFKIKLPKFASGGIVEDGLFMANHGELVGKFSNGKTAVANNEQIIQGISAGVYNAVSSALASNNNNNGGYIANTIVVDGEVIARTVTKAQERQNMRYSPNMG